MSHYSSGLLGMLSALSGNMPEWPAKWSSIYLNSARERLAKRADTLDGKLAASGLGRLVPEAPQITIGSGKHLHLAVLFLDICNFSDWPSSDHAEQLQVLKKLNIFMAEMLSIVRDYGGHFEKNTGDGLMAYFGGTESELETASRTACDCAAVMHAINDYVLTPWFESQSVRPVKFRVGIDAGQMTIARVGIPNLAEQRVAIGSHANIACKIMRFAPHGGICIGNNVHKYLKDSWKGTTSELPPTGFVYVRSQIPYKAWNLNYTPPRPSSHTSLYI